MSGGDSKQPMQAMGAKPNAAEGADEQGRTGGGESGGGAYKDKAQVKGDHDAGGFMGHGGQSHNAYSGPGDDEDADGANPNAPAD